MGDKQKGGYMLARLYDSEFTDQEELRCSKRISAGKVGETFFVLDPCCALNV